MTSFTLIVTYKMKCIDAFNECVRTQIKKIATFKIKGVPFAFDGITILLLVLSATDSNRT